MINRRTFTTLSAAVLLAISGQAYAKADTIIKLGHIANEQHSWHKGSQVFADEVAKRTEGRVEVQIFPNDSLGKEIDLINGMQLGTVDMTITGESLQNWAPKAALLAIPYAYQSLEHMDAVATGEIGKDIEAEVLAKAQIRPLTYFARGPRNLTANREVKSPDDLKAIKLRVPNVPLFVQTWKALGASPTPMAFSEVFTSLQNGTIEAQENPLSLIESATLYEVQKYVNKTEHVRSWIYLAISEITWQKLSEADRNALLEAAKAAQAAEREAFLTDEERLQKSLEDKGMTFVDVDQAAFAAKAKTAVLENAAAEIRPIVEKIFAEQP